MRNRTLRLSGYEFNKEVNIQRFDMSLIAENPGKDSQWLLLFNPGEDLATIDGTMPEWYEKIAILAEAVAYNKIKKPEIEKLYITSPSSRIAAEKYCLTKTYWIRRRPWLEARSIYYDFRIKHVNSEKERQTFIDTKRFIDQLLAEDNGANVEYLKYKKEFYETSYFLTSFEDKVADPRRKWLVYFTTDGRVFLDKTSPKWYRKLASLAEEMGMANKYPELLGDDKIPEVRLCTEVERTIIDKFTDKRTCKNYIKARIELFELLRETGLNTSEDIRQALEYMHLRLKETT